MLQKDAEIGAKGFASKWLKSVQLEKGGGKGSSHAWREEQMQHYKGHRIQKWCLDGNSTCYEWNCSLVFSPWSWIAKNGILLVLLLYHFLALGSFHELCCRTEKPGRGRMGSTHTCWERLKYMNLCWVNQSCAMISSWLLWYHSSPVKALSVLNVKLLSTTWPEMCALLSRAVGYTQTLGWAPLGAGSWTPWVLI